MIKFLRLILALFIANMFCLHVSSQSLGVNTTGAPAANSAILDVSSTDKGMLIPRMSKAERIAIASPATGLMVFQNAPDSTGFYYYDGSGWLWLATAKTVSGWATTGNAATTLANNFFGTTDSVPLSFRQDNKWLGRWNNVTNNYFIGDSAGINTTAASNVAFGSKALQKNLNAYGNVAIGNNSLQNNTTGLRSTAVGDSALFTQSYNPGGTYLTDNTAIGNKALFFNQPTSNITGIKNTAVGNEAMYQNTTGVENTAVGVSALRENKTGSFNAAVGRSAHRLSNSGYYNSYFGSYTGYSDSTGSLNTGIGSFAMYNHQKGNYNVALGANALGQDSTGIGNTAIGTYAGYSSDTTEYTVSVGFNTANYNRRDNITAVGAYAAFANSYGSNNPMQGIENTTIGYAALTGNAIGSQNTIIGYKAMAIFEPGSYTLAEPSRNIAVGDSALYANRGNDNVGVGFKALSKTNSANQSKHVAVGSRALYNTTATYPNTAVGYSSQDSATTGSANTSLGTYSLASNKTGINNTAIGNAAMYEATNNVNPVYPLDNTAVGNDALRFTRYYGQTAIGAGALRNDTSGTRNTAVGYLSSYNNLSGFVNVSVGAYSLYRNKESSFNTAIGFNAMYNHNRSGWNYNTAVGSYALEVDTSGYQNTAVGTSALRNNANGYVNTAVGINAGYYQKDSYNTFIGGYAGVGERSPGNNYAADTGTYNTGLGIYALHRIANGSYNVAVGGSALPLDSSGSNNVAVGYNALSSITNGNENTAVGNNANVFGTSLTNSTVIGANAYVNQSNSMVLGSIAGVSGAVSSVNVGMGVIAPSARLHVRRNGPSGGAFIANPSVIIEDNTQSYVQLSNPTNTENGILSGNAIGPIRSGLVFGADSAVYLRAGGNVSRMIVDNNGYIGIGTLTPLTKLHIYESAAVNPNVRIASVNSTFEPGLELVRTGVSTDWKLRNASAGTLIFSRSSDDFASAAFDEYEMSSTSFRPFTDGSNSLGLSLNRWTTVYAINGTINTSDARDKENITDLNYGLNEVMKLHPVSFNWKENPQWGRKIGFIAQEVQPVLSEVVQVGTLKSKTNAKEESDETIAKESDKLGIYYSDIIPVAVKAIQEQQLLIEKQAKENEELKKKNAQLEKDIQLIKEKLGIKN